MSENATTPTPTDDSPQRFALAPMSSWFVFLTVLLLGGMIGSGGLIALISVIAAGSLHWSAGLAIILIFVLMLAIAVLTWLYARPRWFELSDEGMRIVWPARSRKLPAAAFGEIRRVNEMELGRLYRIFGVGGVFGAFGWYRSQYLQSLDAYITRYDGMIYMRLRNRHPLLITPENPEEFYQALHKILSQQET